MLSNTNGENWVSTHYVPGHTEHSYSEVLTVILPFSMGIHRTRYDISYCQKMKCIPGR